MPRSWASIRLFKPKEPKTMQCWALYPKGGRCLLPYPHLDTEHLDCEGNEWAYPGDIRAKPLQ